MGEKQGQRETIDRMTKYLVERGHMDPNKARAKARDCALKDDRKKDGK